MVGFLVAISLVPFLCRFYGLVYRIKILNARSKRPYYFTPLQEVGVDRDHISVCFLVASNKYHRKE